MSDIVVLSESKVDNRTGFIKLRTISNPNVIRHRLNNQSLIGVEVVKIKDFNSKTGDTNVR